MPSEGFNPGDRVRVSEKYGVKLSEACFDYDDVRSEFKARPNWTALGGLEGVIDEDTRGVKFPCGSIIGIPTTWLILVSPLEMLAEAAE